MKRIALYMLLMAPVAANAQSAIDAMRLSPYQLRGTARFMAMGGAFTALGGDISTLGQNPAGVGVYRSSDIGVTLDIDLQCSSTNSLGYHQSQHNTQAACNAFGYAGGISTGNSVMPYFGWGVSYNRAASLDRTYRGGTVLSTSLSNYIANYTTNAGYQASSLYDPVTQTYTDPYGVSGSYDPYWDTNNDWLSIAAFNAHMITPVNNKANCTSYNGLWTNGTSGDAMYYTRQRGYIDEYNIDLGGNISDRFYWGIGFGITDLELRTETYYDEQLNNALIPNQTANGNAGSSDTYAYTAMTTQSHTTGNGFNFKVGFIARPIDELRLGFAIHTPTYYDITTTYYGDIDYAYYKGDIDYYNSFDGPETPSTTPVATYDWKLKSPWKIMAGIAGVIGGQGIISFDYERSFARDMRQKDGYGDELYYNTEDIKTYFDNYNTYRVGAEYRVTNNLSIRAGFNYTTAMANKDTREGYNQVYTSGTDPSYVLAKDTYYITAGIGYRFDCGIYLDATYAYRHQQSTWHAFTPYPSCEDTPRGSLLEHDNHLVFTAGYRF
ncbi:MAG: outer membrane protein transport protein [Bacteroidales bacterium]|nr:outer membrane protein transport protein [Bacteroidales bacterium]